MGLIRNFPMSCCFYKRRFFDLFAKYGGYEQGHLKLKRPNQLQEVLDIARYLLGEVNTHQDPEIEEKKSKLEQLKAVLEMLVIHWSIYISIAGNYCYINKATIYVAHQNSLIVLGLCFLSEHFRQLYYAETMPRNSVDIGGYSPLSITTSSHGIRQRPTPRMLSIFIYFFIN
jgi:hypothetical protein